VRSTPIGKAKGSINKRSQRCEPSELPHSTPKRARLNSDIFSFFNGNMGTRKTRVLGLNFETDPKKKQEDFQRCEDSLLQPSIPKRRFLNSDGVFSLDKDKRVNETSKARTEAINLVQAMFDEKTTPRREKNAEKAPINKTLRKDTWTQSSEAMSSDSKRKLSSHELETQYWRRINLDQRVDQVWNESRVFSSNGALREAVENQKKKIKIIENQLEKNKKYHAEAESAIKDIAKALKAETQHSVTRSRPTSPMSIETSPHSLTSQIDDYKSSFQIASLTSSTTSDSIRKELSRARFNGAQLVLKVTEAYEEIRRLRKKVDDNQIKTEAGLSTSQMRGSTNLFNPEM